MTSEDNRIVKLVAEAIVKAAFAIAGEAGKAQIRPECGPIFGALPQADFSRVPP